MKIWTGSTRTFCFLGILLLLPGLSFATLLESSTQDGAQLFSESINASGIVKDSEASTQNKLNEWNWNIGYSYQKQTSDGPSPGLSITDTTHQVQGGVGHALSEKWSWSGQLSVQNTPEEYLSGTGLELGLSYSIKFRKKILDDPDDFLPGASFKILGSATLEHRSAQYEKVQYLTYSKSGKSKTDTARIPEPSLNVPQYGLGGGLGLTPFSWFGIKGSFTRYFYNGNLSSLLNSLDNPNLKQGAAVSSDVANMNSGFASGVQAFANYSVTAEIDFYFGDNWSWYSVASLSQSAADFTLYHTYKTTLTYDLTEQWTLGAGYECDLSPGDVSNSGILSVTYQL